MTGTTEAARILSLLVDDRQAEAWEVIDETVRGDHAREVLLATAANAVVPLRLLSERLHVPVEELLLLDPVEGA